jgi:hypothetical protein
MNASARGTDAACARTASAMFVQCPRHKRSSSAALASLGGTRVIPYVTVHLPTAAYCSICRKSSILVVSRSCKPLTSVVEYCLPEQY